jgi:hypothetical protein
MEDEVSFNKNLAHLESFRLIHDKEKVWIPGRPEHKAFAKKRLRLLQTLAIKRFEIFNKYKSEIF